MSSFGRFATPFFRSMLIAAIGLSITSTLWAQGPRDLSGVIEGTVSTEEGSVTPADVQAKISSPAFGSFYNSVYREYRIHVLFGK